MLEIQVYCRIHAKRKKSITPTFINNANAFQHSQVASSIQIIAHNMISLSKIHLRRIILFKKGQNNQNIST